MADLHYKYINPIRKLDGKLRSWAEHQQIVQLENSLDLTQCHYTFTQERKLQEWKHKLVDGERELQVLDNNRNRICDQTEAKRIPSKDNS